MNIRASGSKSLTSFWSLEPNIYLDTRILYKYNIKYPRIKFYPEPVLQFLVPKPQVPYSLGTLGGTPSRDP